MRQNVRMVKLNGTRIQSQFIFLIEKSVFYGKNNSISKKICLII